MGDPVRFKGPCENRMMGDRWTVYCQALHVQKLRTTKPFIDVSAPRSLRERDMKVASGGGGGGGGGGNSKKAQRMRDEVRFPH